MKPLVVTLPAVSKRQSHRQLLKATVKTVNKSTTRNAKWRQKQREDPSKLMKMKLKKRQQNKLYKDKMRELRTVNEMVDDKIKKDQRRWKHKSREIKKRSAKKNVQDTTIQKNNGTSTPNTPNISSPPSSSPVQACVSSSAQIRKRAQRVKQKFPDTPDRWASTLNHIIRNATPRRRSMITMTNATDQHTADNACVATSTCIEMNKVGRPKSEYAGIKKRLSFTPEANSLYANKYSMNRYRKRQKQVKRLSKTQSYNEKWQRKIDDFLETKSRIMPNKKDTILIDGERVAKRHLLCTKFKVYTSFKNEYPDYSRKFKTFIKMIPRNFKRLDETCRRVCVCTKDFNIEQKLEALNKLVVKHKLPELKKRHTPVVI